MNLKTLLHRLPPLGSHLVYADPDNQTRALCGRNPGKERVVWWAHLVPVCHDCTAELIKEHVKDQGLYNMLSADCVTLSRALADTLIVLSKGGGQDEVLDVTRAAAGNLQAVTLAGVTNG